MGSKFFDVVRWELEEKLSLPVILFLIFSGIVATLVQPTNNIEPTRNFLNLYNGSDTFFLFLTFISCALLSHSFAGDLSKGETKLLLSYPIKRWQLFGSKLVAMFLTVFFIYGTAYSIHLYLDSLSFLEPMFYLTLFVFSLQLMVVCSITIVISLFVKNEIMSLLASILLLFGFDNIIGNQSYISTNGRFMWLFQYFGELTHEIKPFGENFIVTVDDTIIAILIPVLIFIVLIAVSYVYFVHIMEVD